MFTLIVINFIINDLNAYNFILTYVALLAEFGSFNWNHAESKIVYIAERKLPKSEPFYKRQSIKSNNKAANNDDSPTSKVS